VYALLISNQHSDAETEALGDRESTRETPCSSYRR
jgi:hypothetical protein